MLVTKKLMVAIDFYRMEKIRPPLPVQFLFEDITFEPFCPEEIWRVHLQKQITPFLKFFKNLFFSLCIPINFNQTAVGLFWLGIKNKTKQKNS